MFGWVEFKFACYFLDMRSKTQPTSCSGAHSTYFLTASNSSSETRASVHCSECCAGSGISLSIYQKTWLTVPHQFSFLRIHSSAKSRYEMWGTYHCSFCLEAMSFSSGLYLLSLGSGTLILGGLEVRSGRLKYYRS